MWDIQGSPQRTRWDLQLVSVDLISPLRAYTISIQGKGRQLESRGERITESRLPEEVTHLIKVTLKAKSKGSNLNVPSPLISHWDFPLPKTAQQLGARSMLMSPQPVQQPRQGQVEKGRQEAWRHKETQLKHFQAPKPSDHFKHPNLPQIHINCTIINYITSSWAPTVKNRSSTLQLIYPNFHFDLIQTRAQELLIYSILLWPKKGVS